MKLLLIMIVLLVATQCLADEQISKVDKYTAKVIITNIAEKDDVKTTLSQEKNFTLAELNERKASAEGSLASWQKAKAETETNIIKQTEQIALWDRLIKGFGDQGIIDKPEPVIE